MALPAQITTNLWSDFKNSFVGPFAKIVQGAVQDTDSNNSNPIGASASNNKLAQSFQVSIGGDAASVDLHLIRLNSPTDNVIAEICADNGGVPGTVLATSVPVAATSITNVTGAYYKFNFLMPAALVTGTTYWIVASRSGSFDATNGISWRTHTSNPYANGMQAILSSGTWGTVSSTDHRFRVNIKEAGTRYFPCVDKTNNKVRMFKSTDNGETWSEQDTANAPAVSTTANTKSMSALQADTLIAVCKAITATAYDIFRFNTANDTWGSQFSTSSSLNVNTNVAGTAPVLVGLNATGSVSDYRVAYNGTTETVMGSARRRIKMKRRLSGAWPGSPGYDVVGSPNTPDLTTFPGTAVDHDLRAAITDGNGVFHMFWTQSDDSNLRHRQYNTNDTFSTLNNIGSTPAVTSNTAAYSVGIPANFYKNGEWNIAIPYVDSGVIKVARCVASGAATAANWTITGVVTATIETTNSNPCVLVADNEQGGKLFLFYTKTDGKLYYTHDQAADNWVAEQELHPGTKTVGAISGGVMVDAIGIAYLDTAPVTDDLKFDSL